MLADRLVARGEVGLALPEYHTVVHSYVEQDLHGKAVRLLQRMVELAPDRTELVELRTRLAEVDLTLPRRDLHIARLARRRAETLGPTSLTAPDLRRHWNAFGVSPFVNGVDDDALGLFFSACEVHHISPMSVVVRSGQSYPRCCLLAEGAIDATRIGPDATRLSLLRFLPGDVIGDRAFLDGAPWAVECRTPVDVATTVLRLTPGAIESWAPDLDTPHRLLAGLREHGRDGDLERVART